MAVITIQNPDVSDSIKTFLSQEYSSGTTLNVDSSSSFPEGGYIIVGEPGLENTEVTNLTAPVPTANTIEITGINHSHPRGTPVYYINWDRYYLEYKTTLTGSWTAYASMPLALYYDSLSTEYRDTAATTTYYWRYRYYSTEKGAYSDYSDTLSSAGWARNSVGYMVEQVRKVINDPEAKTITDTEIIRYFNTAQDNIYSLYDRWWFLLKVGTAIDAVASQKKYELPSDFGRMHTVLFNYVDSSATTNITYNLKYLPIVEFDYESRDNTADDDDNMQFYTIYPGDSTNESGYLYVWPTPETAGLDITPRYYKKMSDLDSFADETDVPIPSMLEDYALGEIFKIRKEESKAEYYDKLFRSRIELLKLQQRKQVGQPRQLWKWQGRNANDRLFGTRAIYNDEQRENEW